jgi:hypothetical protein
MAENDPNDVAVNVITLTDAPETSRCAICSIREGSPPDCTPGKRHTLDFGRAGGVVLCDKALTRVRTQITRVNIESLVPKIPDVEFKEPE